jgi:hypothetical protein
MRTLITDHGAIPDGAILATAAIQAAIDAVAAAGGGTVVVPSGRFLTGMIRLKDRIELHLARGAVLIASPRVEDHLPIVQTDGGNGDHWPTGEGSFHLVLAQGCTDIALTGPGTLLGNGPAWYGAATPESPWPLAIHKDWRRMGALVLISKCRKVLIEDVTLGDVGNWTLHLHESDRITVRGIIIDNPAEAPNADGIDITGCRGVAISGCHIDTCDDAICLKTLPNGRSCEDIAVTNCILRTHCVALKLGCSEGHQDMRNVVFSDCTVRGSHRAVGIYSLRGAVVENIMVENIVCDTRAPLMFTRPIHLDLRRNPQTGKAGALRSVRIAGLTATTSGRCVLTAEAGLRLEDILLRDVTLRYPVVDDPAIMGAEFGGSQFSNKNPWARTDRAALVAENADGLVVDGFSVRWPTGPATADWTFASKIANGTQRTFTPADWTLAASTPFAAVAGRNLTGGRLDRRGLAGLAGGPAFDLDEGSWRAG